MLRTALRPRWAVLLLVVFLAAAGMVRLGHWQLDRAREHGTEAQQRPLDRAPAPLESVLRAREGFPGAAVDRPVTAVGRWDGSHQLLVAAHPREVLSGTGPVTRGTGWWVLTPFVLPDGSAVPVVRGWVASPEDRATAVTALAAGQVRLQGVLRPAEPVTARVPGAGAGLPSGRVDVVAVTELVQRWPYRLLTGYLVLVAQSPTGSGVQPEPVRVRRAGPAG